MESTLTLNTDTAAAAAAAAATSPRPFHLPTDCGRRLLPHVVDEIAASEPDRVYAAIPISNDGRGSWVDITYRTLAIAVSRCARWIDDGLGKSEKDDVLLYMGPTDLRFPIVFLGALKTGRIAQFSSTRNSLQAHISLLQSAGCKTALLPDEAPGITSDIVASCKLKVLRAPSLKQLLVLGDGGREDEMYEWKRDFDAVRTKPCLILHTSGSTGIPKPVWVTHGAFASNDMHQMIPSLGGRATVLAKNMSQNRIFIGFPLFHAACMTLIMAFGVFHGAICVLPPPGPLTAEIIDHAHTHAKVEGSILPPSLIVDLYNSAPKFENLKRNIRWVGYTGGPLPSGVGDDISRHLRVVTLVGSTETLFLPTEAVDGAEDWQQVPVSPFLGHEYRQTPDGLAELIIVRREELEQFQGCFCTLPDKQEHSMGDLYIQHQSNPRYWSFGARADDLICFSTAEKLNPISIEGTISAHPLVKGALVGGHGEFQASLLVEPYEPSPTTSAEKEKFIDTIWPTVMDANRVSVAHGRIMRGYIFFTSPDRPLPRVPKGIIRRDEALKLYANEFKNLYTSKDIPQTENSLAVSPRDTRRSLLQVIEAAKEQTEYTAASTETAAEVLMTRLEELSNRFDSALLRFEDLLKSIPKTARVESSNGQEASPDRPGALTTTSSPSARSISRSSLDSENGASSRTSCLSAFASGVNESDGKDKKRACSPHPLDLCKLLELKEGLYNVISSNAIVYNLTETADLFNCGLDSQQISVVVDAINGWLSSSDGTSAYAREVTRKDIYNHPTIEQLASVILQ